MTRLSTIRMALIAFSLMLVFNLGAEAKSPDCSKTTDADIVNAIQEKMKVKYESQMEHINVSVKDGVVTLQGWALTKKDVKAIAKIAKKANCVKSVVNNLTVGAGGGCGPGTIQCGAICIPSTQTCNIKGK